MGKDHFEKLQSASDECQKINKNQVKSADKKIFYLQITVAEQYLVTKSSY